MKSRKRNKKEKIAEKQLERQLGLFEKLPDACDACEEDFNKTDKEMVQSWSVVVREREEVVRLYCPSCWQAAKDLIEHLNSQDN